MSKGRVFSRPRTKVYESNYNIGESYYKPAIDRLDDKYGRYGPPSNGDLFGLRSPLPPPPPQPVAEPPAARSALRDLEDEFFGEGQRRRPASALLGEYDSIFEGRMRNGMAKERTPVRGGRTLDEEIEDDLSSSMQRLRAARSARAFADEVEELESSFNSKKDSRMRPRLDFSDKLMDSVGLSGRSRAALEEEGSTLGRRRMLKMTSDMGEGEEMGAKWTALKPGASSRRSYMEEGEESSKWTSLKPASRRNFLEEEEESSVVQSGAAARARKSRARLEDLESEMQALSDRSTAREKRVRDLRALVQENEASALDNLQATVRMKSSIQSEKKTVTF